MFQCLLAFSAAAAPYELSHPTSPATSAVSGSTPDGKPLASAISGSDLVISRQDSIHSPESWVELARFDIGTSANYHQRLKSGKTTTWVAWQGYPLGTGIYIRQVLPTLGPIELVGGSEGQSPGFDLAIDNQERPCLISYSSTFTNPEGMPFIRVHRRLAADSWEQLITAYYDSDGSDSDESIRRPEAVAIAVSGNRLDIFDLGWAEVFNPVLGTRRYSNLYHTQLETTTTLANSTFKDSIVITASTGTAQNLQPAITDLSAANDNNGNLAIAYSLPAERRVNYAYYSSAFTEPWTSITLIQPSGTVDGTYSTSTSLAFDATNRPHVSWQSSSAGNIARSIRTGSTWSFSSPDNIQMSKPSFSLDKLGNALFVGISGNGAVAARPLGITDPDGNGFTGLQEAAFTMTGLANPSERAPATGIVTIGGVNYPTISYFRPTGGSTTDANPFSHPNYTYTLETSGDLVTWSTAAGDLVHHETTSGTGYNRSTWRSSAPLAAGSPRFFRIRVSDRQ